MKENVNASDLFGGDADRPQATRSPDAEPDAPLAARMRPRALQELRGQIHLIGEGQPLRGMIEDDALSSMILWGPPGSGKTTLARIVAGATRAVFVPFSAVMEGVARVREIVAQAEARRIANGRRTILFVDEVHHFSRSQQDTFLPHVESGGITLIGATTENPSFALNGALLSRTQVFVLEPLSTGDVRALLTAALADAERGLGALRVQADEDALDAMAEQADGDARRALNALEAAARIAGAGGRITVETAARAMQRRLPRHDRAGEEHYNLLSAFHKSIRGSDPQAALYWLGRMLEAGEAPRHILRRLAAAASEDIGMADPQAMVVAVAALHSFEFLGPPEGFLPIAEATVYLATAPKSNRSYLALKRAREAARASPAEPVPLHLRNAPTGLMADLGYHEGYEYPFDREEHFSPQAYLPAAVQDLVCYEPSRYGYEKRIAERMAWWQDARGSADSGKEEQKA